MRDREEERDFYDRDEDQEKQPVRKRKFGDEETKTRPPIHCGSCIQEIKQGDAIFEVVGAYVGQTRRKVNICFRCAMNPPKAVVVE